jgi:phosphoribosylformylglycinamidine synthase
MAAELGAVVDLERVPLKYAGLSYCEIWISEAQERMVLAVPPERLDALLRICREEGVEATDIGEFTGDRRLRLRYEGTQVADLDLEFVHGGMPVARREAVLPRPRCEPDPPPEGLDPAAAILRVLRDPNIASKEWIIRQYDHEVQGRSAVKALVGAHHDGPSDAAVVRPRRDGWRGIAVGLGILPRYGAWDPYAMAASAVDEAVRNVLAVGARPDRIALLDNFSWGRPDDPEQLGALVAAADACRDVAIAYGTPFISGKDSLNNEFRWGGRRFPVPPTLLISAIGIVDDVRRCVTSDAKEPGNRLALVGVTDDEMGGSALWAAFGLDGGRAPRVVPERARPIFRALHAAITAGIVRACHDLSEGGLAIAAAEMAIGGALGIELDLRHAVRTPEAASDAVLLFSESNTRFLVEVRESDAKRFEMAMAQAPWAWVGKVTADPTFVVRGLSGSEIARIPVGNLRRAWKEPLAW